MRIPFRHRQAPPASAGGAARLRYDVQLAVSVAGEVAQVVDLGAILAGEAPIPFPILPGQTEDSIMVTVMVLPDTTPPVGVWLGTPGAFTPA